MASDRIGILDQLLQRRELRRWSNAAEKAKSTELETLRVQRARARKLRTKLDQLVHVADGRLALPRVGSTSFTRPGGTLWAWRPQLWRGPLGQRGIAAVESKTALGDEVVLYHDCKSSELTLRQTRNLREEDLAPFALRLDVFGFDGSFLSLVLEAPKPATAGLLRRHLIQLRAIIEVEKPIEMFARLNIQNGPNTEKITLELPMGKPDIMVEFDLAYSDINEKRVEKMWIDLIFEDPAMNQITVRDITFARYPRAEL